MALGALTTGQSQAQGRSAPAAGVVAFSVTVPSIVLVLVDPSTTSRDGAPVVRVVTNDPAIRAATADGVTPEFLRRVPGADDLTPRGKGAEGVDQRAAGDPLIRYTVVAS